VLAVGKYVGNGVKDGTGLVLGCGGADRVGAVVPVTGPVGVPEATVVEDSAAEVIGDPENCAEGVGIPELLGEPEIVWRLETV